MLLWVCLQKILGDLSRNCSRDSSEIFLGEISKIFFKDFLRDFCKNSLEGSFINNFELCSRNSFRDFYRYSVSDWVKNYSNEDSMKFQPSKGNTLSDEIRICFYELLHFFFNTFRNLLKLPPCVHKGTGTVTPSVIPAEIYLTIP